jgi:Iron-containing redox enzyme
MTTVTPSERLRLKLDLAYPVLRASAERVWTSPDLRVLYPVYLETMHGIVRSAVSLLEMALERSRALASQDAVAAGLVPYFARHATEETGHDRWLLEDLEALGIDSQRVLRRTPSQRVATLVGAQYYWLLHCHPLALLGHLAAIEGYAPRPGFAERLGELTGFPLDAFRTISRHERLDLRHGQELLETIDSLPLRPEDETLLGISGLHTMLAAVEVFEEIANVAEHMRIEVEI